MTKQIKVVQSFSSGRARTRLVQWSNRSEQLIDIAGFNLPYHLILPFIANTSKREDIVRQRSERVLLCRIIATDNKVGRQTFARKMAINCKGASQYVCFNYDDWSGTGRSEREPDGRWSVLLRQSRKKRKRRNEKKNKPECARTFLLLDVGCAQKKRRKKFYE